MNKSEPAVADQEKRSVQPLGGDGQHGSRSLIGDSWLGLLPHLCSSLGKWQNFFKYVLNGQ